MRNRKITICACTSRSFIDKTKVAQLATVLRTNGYQVTLIADLCEMVMNRSSELTEIAETDIFACYPRTIQSQMDWLDLQANNLHDIRNNDLNNILLEFGFNKTEEDNYEANPEIVDAINTLPVAPGSDAWYPILDKSKCTNCGKCHDFCLFGVYTIENKQVKVIQPQNCKNNCPACARVCPSKAIIFPKYAKSPINGGTIEEEQFDPAALDNMYQERLKYRLRQRRTGISLLKNNNQ